MAQLLNIVFKKNDLYSSWGFQVCGGRDSWRPLAVRNVSKIREYLVRFSKRHHNDNVNFIGPRRHVGVQLFERRRSRFGNRRHRLFFVDRIAGRRVPPEAEQLHRTLSVETTGGERRAAQTVVELQGFPKFRLSETPKSFGTHYSSSSSSSSSSGMRSQRPGKRIPHRRCGKLVKKTFRRTRRDPRPRTDTGKKRATAASRLQTAQKFVAKRRRTETFEEPVELAAVLEIGSGRSGQRIVQ